MLRLVLQIHRFVAIGFGIFMLLVPDALTLAFDGGDTTVPDRPREEMLILQSWACFVLIVGLIAHCAVDFDKPQQMQVGRCILFGLTCLDFLYARVLWIVPEMYTTDTLPPIAILLGIFFSLTLAYASALLLEPPTKNGTITPQKSD